jgi:hypothetical protein
VEDLDGDQRQCEETDFGAGAADGLTGPQQAEVAMS